MDTFFLLIDATPVSYLACSLALVVSSATHRITGQAFGLICAPLVALAAPAHIPALILLCGLPVMLYGFKGDWAQIRWSEISYAFAGRVGGAVLAATAVASLADRSVIAVAVAACVLLGVAASLTRVQVAITPVSLTVAGFLSGAMATLTSIGAPPMGLLYQRQSFGHARATLNAFFLFGALASVAVLVLYGLISLANVLMTAALLPAMAAGVVLGDLALRRLRIASLRPFILTVSVGTALLLLARAAFG